MTEVEQTLMNCLNCTFCPLMWSAAFQSMRLTALYRPEIPAPVVLFFQRIRVELSRERVITLSWVDVRDEDFVSNDDPFKSLAALAQTPEESMMDIEPYKEPPPSLSLPPEPAAEPSKPAKKKRKRKVIDPMKRLRDSRKRNIAAMKIDKPIENKANIYFSHFAPSIRPAP